MKQNLIRQAKTASGIYKTVTKKGKSSLSKLVTEKSIDYTCILVCRSSTRKPPAARPPASARN